LAWEIRPASDTILCASAVRRLGGPDARNAPGVRGDVAVRQIEARRVHTGADEPRDHFR